MPYLSSIDLKHFLPLALTRFLQCDAKVGASIFQSAIVQGLKGKTIVLVTNQTNLLPHCKRIIVLKDGKIQGPLLVPTKCLDEHSSNSSSRSADGSYATLKGNGIEFDKLSKKPTIMAQQVIDDNTREIPKWQIAEVSKNAHQAFGDFDELDHSHNAPPSLHNCPPRRSSRDADVGNH